MTSKLYQIPVQRIDGQEITLAEYQGKVLLIVNVASKCGLTKQYEGLENIYNTYKAEGFEVLGFPANDFAGQEPGTNEEIQTFCQTNFNVDFPMFSKIEVTGPGQHPLYQYLTSEKRTGTGNGDDTLKNKLAEMGHLPKNDNDLLWNFEKFIISRTGEVVARFSPNVLPTEPILTQVIEAEIKKSPANV